MSAADRTEKVLRDIHVLFSKAEPYNGSKRDVIVNKNEMMDLLKELNACMYDMIDEHELSQTKKDKANREMQKQGDDIIFAASRKAEDIYAASIMYTDNALNDIQQIIEDAGDAIAKIYEDAKDKMASEKQTIKSNQSELKSQLGDLIDTQKYLHLIEEENRRLRLEREKGEKGDFAPKDAPSYANVQPEIRNASDATELPPIEGRVDFNDVIFRYEPDGRNIINLVLRGSGQRIFCMEGIRSGRREKAGGGKRYFLSLRQKIKIEEETHEVI